jgi:hypothetical protein
MFHEQETTDATNTMDVKLGRIAYSDQAVHCKGGYVYKTSSD